MGFESRFIIGTAHAPDSPTPNRDGGRWVQVHADFFLGKLPYDTIFHEKLLNYGDRSQDFYFYSRDGEEEVEVRRDMYDVKLEKFGLEEILDAFHKDWNDETTRNMKIPPFLAALQMYQNMEDDFTIPALDRELVLLHYGY